VILAHTVMGRGVSFMADDHRWHGKPPKPAEGERALKELGTSFAEWSARLLADGAGAAGGPSRNGGRT
jgi:transketolase